MPDGAAEARRSHLDARQRSAARRGRDWGVSIRAKKENDMSARNELQESRQRLTADVRTVVDDAEALLRAAKNEAGEGMAQARGKLEESVAAAREAMVRLERAAVDRASAAGRATDRYVHENPWQAIAAGAAVGALIGVLLSRR
jgi:ElaB/YqjD/DUF883 family membrane-anchored ribosome-binding protein